jgi:hypothetical protein
VKVACNPKNRGLAVVCVAKGDGKYTASLCDTSKFERRPPLYELNFRSKSYKIKWSQDGNYFFIAGDKFVFIFEKYGRVLFEDRGFKFIHSVDFNGNTVEVDGFKQRPLFQNTLEETQERFALKRDSTLLFDLREKFEERLPSEVVDIIMDKVHLPFKMPAEKFTEYIYNGETYRRFFKLCDHMLCAKNISVYCEECKIGCK